jgi:excisionase family DNA binding protein
MREILQHIATFSYLWLHTQTKSTMSSNIRIQRICQYCGKEFTAKTTVTQYCGDPCSKKAYKVKQRKSKIEASNQLTKSVILKPVEEIKAKEFLSISETCQLLGLSRWTVWRAIKANELPAAKVGRRSIIKRSHLDQMFDKGPPVVPALQPKKHTIQVSDCYTLTEVQQLYSISEKALYEVIKRNSIPKIKEGIYAYVPKVDIDKLLGSKAV